MAAFFAALLVFAAINSARKDNGSAVAPVSVLVAGQLIPKGSSGQAVAEQQLFRTVRISDNARVSGVVTDIGQIRDKVATADIYPGQQISANSFAASGGALTAKLAASDRAVKVSLDSSHGLVGDISAGDHVDLLAGFNIQGGASGTRAVMKPLARNVPVLKVDKGDSSGSGTNATSNMTVKVSDVMATKVAFTADNGKLWVILRPAAGARETSPSIVTVESVLFGVKPLQVRGKR
jgi:Flp pilus assembly protein CpaB